MIDADSYDEFWGLISSVKSSVEKPSVENESLKSKAPFKKIHKSATIGASNLIFGFQGLQPIYFELL